MERRYSVKEIVMIIIFIICSMASSLLRRYFLWSDIYIYYSILMSLLQGVFTGGLQYIIFKRWIKNKKLLITIIVLLFVFYSMAYIIKIINTFDGSMY